MARDRYQYRGVDIDRHGPNSMGLRWIARNPREIGPVYLRADTLAGMRDLIRYALSV
jgi:hypothetical protein